MRTTTAHDHGMGWAPASRVGWWSIALAGLAFGSTVAVAVAFALGLEPAESFSDDWLLTAVGAATAAGGAAAVATGAVALTRRHDHSWLLVAAVVLGLLLVALSAQQAAEGLGWLES